MVLIPLRSEARFYRISCDLDPLSTLGIDEGYRPNGSGSRRVQVKSLKRRQYGPIIPAWSGRPWFPVPLPGDPRTGKPQRAGRQPNAGTRKSHTKQMSFWRPHMPRVGLCLWKKETLSSPITDDHVILFVSIRSCRGTSTAIRICNILSWIAWGHDIDYLSFNSKSTPTFLY